MLEGGEEMWHRRGEVTGVSQVRGCGTGMAGICVCSISMSTLNRWFCSVLRVSPLPPFDFGLCTMQVQVGKDTTAVPVIKDRPLPDQKEVAVYKVNLPSLSPGSSVTVLVELVLFKAILPFPLEITQSENQLVRFTGNSYVYSPYQSKTQSTTFTLPTTNIESFSRVVPTNSAEKTLTYGPYADVAPFSYAKVDIHFENNGPFLMVAELERIIEVSHWGNVAVEEYLHIKHIGWYGSGRNGR